MEGDRGEHDKATRQLGTADEKEATPPPRPGRTRLPPPSVPPLTKEERAKYIIPKSVPIESVPYVYDPYGGLPRREDLDPYYTTLPPPRPTHGHDLQPTHQSFRDVVLSMQSWGAQWPEPTDTSVKRWARRALRADARILVHKTDQPSSPSSPPAAVSVAPLPEEEPTNLAEVQDGGGDDEAEADNDSGFTSPTVETTRDF